MKLQLNVRQKITVYILGTALILFAITIGYFSSTARQAAYKNITELNNAQTDHYASLIEDGLNNDMALARTLSKALQEYDQLPFEDWRELIMGMYKQVMIANPHIDAIWDSWELSHIDPEWDKPHGRWLHIYYREQFKLLSKYEKRSLDGDPAAYAAIKKGGKEAIIEPYLSTLQKGGFMTSLTSPIIKNGKFIGVIGVDLFLGQLQDLISGIKTHEDGAAFLLSNNGTFVAHPDTSIFSKSINDVYPELSSNHNIVKRIKKGEKFAVTHTNNLGEKLYFNFSPIEIGHTTTPWSMGLMVPENTILEDANRNFNIGMLVGIVGIILLVTIIFLLANNLTKPIKRITTLLTDLSKGKIDESMHISLNTGDEISKMAKALSLSIDGLLAKTEFSKSIGKGNLDAKLKLLSDEDVLGKSLLEMRQSLIDAKNEERKRKDEDEKRRWVNEGLAKFGDILRQNNENLSKLGDEIIKELVWYLEASLGGIFVKNESNDPYTYDLVSAFAYDRKRYLQKSFEQGEGLVGSCAAEEDTIYLKEIPQEYIDITSGLGGTNPNTLLLIPLKIEGEVLGVIEIGFLKSLQDFEIAFVEKIGESIASTLRTVRINQKTNELLKKSQEQTEMMAAQEEEMRQNMEELQATQEESARKAIEMEGLIDALNESSYVMEYDADGKIISINDAYLELLGITREDAIGKHHSDNVVMTDEQKEHYDKFWRNLKNGKIQKQTTSIKMEGKDFTFVETYTPIKNEKGDIYKILKISTDVSSASRKKQ
ncbi:MAG: cache domain-containing protein [Bacteroidales bacterium]